MNTLAATINTPTIASSSVVVFLIGVIVGIVLALKLKR